ncbi:DUF1266 domain-containing protein [Streptomyces sp. N2-109]|uniref:DUF1266 domain-containing protein n=1 Tax=Streptomyces gossypii TaxID=2883101 RepID=A0ABT2JT20_9ACTN|nr:DUF1266 domain-containing protein [Streptomyces gossypii]MCT2591020.1 DUF1266 domain-containing protein [Streptomyces gossypii]
MGMWNAPGGSDGPDAGRPRGYPDWQAPTEIEHGLYEAKMREDWPAYFDILAGTELYHAAPRGYLDSNPGKVRFTSFHDPVSGGHGYVLLTSGVLPPPAPDPVFFHSSLGWFAREWPDDTAWAAINPGTPCEAHFATTAAHRAVWQQHADRVEDHGHHQLRTLWSGALQGPVAHGLACTALMYVNNGEFWNMLGHGLGYDTEKSRLEKWWGVTGRATWFEYQERLLHGDMVDARWEFVLRVRESLRRAAEAGPGPGAAPGMGAGGGVDVAQWRELAGQLARQHVEGSARTWDAVPDTAVDAPADTPADVHSGVPVDTSAKPAADADREVEEIQRIIGQIQRYESRFRADGLLPDGHTVRSVLSWDFGRASGMARWGLACRFCDVAEAEQAVIRTSRVSQSTYDSWEEFSVGYILGRCLHFDEEEFGSWYEDMVAAHHILTTDPDSPWLNIPWK